MRHHVRRLASLCVWLLSMAPAMASATDRFILRTVPGAPVAQILDRHGLRLERDLDAAEDDGVFLVEAPGTTPPAELEDEVEADSDVLGFEPVQDVWVPEVSSRALLRQSTSAILDGGAAPEVLTFYGATARASYVNQPAVGLVRLGDVRDLAIGTGIIVAVIDTGVDPRHPLLGPWLVPGYDFVRNIPGAASEMRDLPPSLRAAVRAGRAASRRGTRVNQSTSAILDTTALPAGFGHGTMVAGIVRLVAPGARIMPLKAFRADGTGTTFDIVRAIYYAVDHGAKVINMSFSMPGFSAELLRAIAYATSRGIICVASAGNDAEEDPRIYPAAFSEVISVAATDNFDARSWFTNYGDEFIYLAAPGEGVVTTYPGDRYAAAWGTSFSAPFVTGAAALLAQLNPAIDQDEAAGDLAHAVELSEDLGHGRLDLYEGVVRRVQ